MDSENREKFLPTTDNLFSDCQKVTLVARGKSMSPLIMDGDIVGIEPIYGNPRIGDVVLLKQGLRLLLHRIVARTCKGVITRGDACSEEDGLTAYGHVIGRAVSVQGKGHNFHLRFPTGYLIAAGLRLRKIPFLFAPISKAAKIILNPGNTFSRKP